MLYSQEKKIKLYFILLNIST